MDVFQCSSGIRHGRKYYENCQNREIGLIAQKPKPSQYHRQEVKYLDGHVYHFFE